jgi:F0F1-type ATP synthase assembly protein I
MAAAAPGRWSFVWPILLLGLACSLVLVAALHLAGHPLQPWLVTIPLYFTLLALVLHAWQERGMAHDPNGFVRRFMGGLAIKMFLSLFLLVALLIALPKEEVVPVVIGFILTYLVFLGFSVARLTGLLRRQRP